MLATEADVLRTLRTGTYTLHELYDLCEQRTGTGPSESGFAARSPRSRYSSPM